MSRSRSLHAALVFCLLTFLAPATAQQRLPAPRTDWGQWERLVPHARATPTGPLSPDGRWLVYGITRTNGKNELRIVNVADGTAKTAAFGEQPAFSPDSKWIGYAIGYSEAEQEKLRKQKKPLQRKLGVMTLASGETQTFDAVESFAFDESGTRLALRHYPPEPEKKDESAASSAAGADEDEPRGATLLVLDLTSGGTMTFGNVSEYAWQTRGPSTALGVGRLLAMTVRPPHGAGHGVHLFDPSSGAVRVLDSGEAPYTGLAWRKDADDLAVLRSKTDARRDGPTEVLLAWTGLSAGGRAHTLDPTGLPSGKRTVDWTKPVWSRDGGVVVVGVADWDEKPPELPKPAPGDAEEEDEPAAVDVWHPRDVDVMPKQKVNAKRDRRRSLLHAWHLETGRLVPLARSFSEDVQPLKGQRAALLVDRAPYEMPRSFGRISADLYIVDVGTGERRKVRERVNERYVQASGEGRYVLFFDADHYWTYDVASGTTTNITKAIATSFTNRESDATTPQKPPYGAAGWTLDETAVLLYDKFDVWEVRADGSRPTKLTDGAADQIEHRYVRFDRDEDGIDRTKPIYFRSRGVWSKRSGYSVVKPGATVAERLVWQDKLVDGLARAQNADVHAYIVSGFDDSPDYFAGASLSSARRVTDTNPFQSQYAWGRSELVEYKSDRGERLQGALLYPANYERGKAYPMIVYMYEKLSDDLHLYTPLSDRQYYNVSVFTSLGYLVLKPDIVFRPREPGISVVECVVPAVKRVVQMGLVDPQRIGILGHSWGGFDTTFLATHTDTFAAAVAGAPITDLISNYGNHHWSQGIAETDRIETGQQRMQVPLWEDLPAYLRNSAVFGVATMKTPLLLEAGDNDGTVHWHQSVELYNVARRAGKQVAMVVYAGEDHGLRKKANQQDYQQRIIDWFGHYLQGQPAAAWIEKGVTFLQSQRDRKMRRPAVPKTTTEP